MPVDLRWLEAYPASEKNKVRFGVLDNLLQFSVTWKIHLGNCFNIIIRKSSGTQQASCECLGIARWKRNNNCFLFLNLWFTFGSCVNMKQHYIHIICTYNHIYIYVHIIENILINISFKPKNKTTFTLILYIQRFQKKMVWPPSIQPGTQHPTKRLGDLSTEFLGIHFLRLPYRWDPMMSMGWWRSVDWLVGLDRWWPGGWGLSLEFGGLVKLLYIFLGHPSSSIGAGWFHHPFWKIWCEPQFGSWNPKVWGEINKIFEITT